MEEDEYFEENMPVEEASTNNEVRDSTRVVSQEREPAEDAPITFEPTETARTESIFTTVGTSQGGTERTSSSLDETRRSTAVGSSKRTIGLQKNMRARKRVIQPSIATPATAMDANVYSEELGCGWARCYSGYKKIPKEKAIQQIDPHVLAKLVASASKPLSTKEEPGNRKGKHLEPEEPASRKKKRNHQESAVTPSTAQQPERSVSPLKLKSPIRGGSEIPGPSMPQPEPTKARRISREKSETPVVVEMNKKENKEETKEERKERKRKAKEENEREKEREREKENAEKEMKKRRQYEEELEAKKKKEKTKRKESETAVVSEVVDISNWDEATVVAHFGLQKMSLIIKNLPQEVIDAALAVEPTPTRKSRSPKAKAGRRVLIDSDSSSSPAPSGSWSNEAPSSFGAEIVKQPKEKKKRIEESEDVLESPASPPPPRSPSPENSRPNDIRKKSKSIVRKCIGCQKNLHDCVDQWYKTLGADSQYCSVDCIEAIVKKIKENASWQGGAKVLMVNATGVIRRDLDAPTVDQLGQYIRQSSAFIPLCLSENVNEWENKEKEAKAKATEKASKFMSKESDILRANLKMKIAYELFAHGRLILKMGMPDCRTKAADIEKELFKVCKDVNSSKYRFFNEKFKTLFKQYRNFASKIVAGYITIQRLVNLEETELVDFARNNSVNLNEEEEVTAETRALQLPLATEESRAAAQEMAKHLKTAPTPKMGRIPKKPKTQLSTLDSLLGDGMADTTSQHNSHFYDSNCSICAGKAKEKAEKEKREVEEREKFREQERQRKEKNRTNGGDKREHYNEKKRELKRFDGKKGREDEDDEERMLLNPSDPLGLNKLDSPPRNSGYESDNDDYTGGGGSGDSPLVWQKTPAEAAKAKKPFFDETWRTWRTDDEVWRGQMVMGTITFVTSLKAISNKAAFEMRDSADLPVTLTVKGRIKELVVFEYLNGLRRSESQDVIVLKMEKPLDIEFEKRFMMMYSDMVNKERYQVIDFGENRRIKDGYLLPIRANQEAPPVLLPWKGPGFPAKHPEMILCVIIRNCQAESVENSLESVKSPALSGSQTRETIEENEQPSISQSRTLQELANESRAILESRRAEPAEPDYLINPKFFENIKKYNAEAAPNQPMATPQPRISSLAELLQFINETRNPKLIKSVVSQFIQDPSLSEGNRQVIHLTLLNRIKTEKGKGVQPTSVSQPETEHSVQPVERPTATVAPAGIPLATTEEEVYDPDPPDETEDEEEETPDEPPQKPLSPSDFDTGQPSTFMNMAGELLSQLAPVPPTSEEEISLNSSNSESNHATSEKRQHPTGEEFIPPAPQAPPSSAVFHPSIPQIPLPSAPSASAELLNIPPPVAPHFSRTPSTGEFKTGEIPVLGSGSAGQDISEANSVEAIIGEDSPPDEEGPEEKMGHLPHYNMGPPPMHGGNPLNMPQPMLGGPQQYMGIPSMYHQPPLLGALPPTGVPMASLPMGPPLGPYGAPPLMCMGPPPMQTMPPGPMSYPSQMAPPMMPPMGYPTAPPPISKHSIEVHGSAGFKGLAPSLGGKGNNNSIIDFFNSSVSTSQVNRPGPAPTVVLPAGATLPGRKVVHNKVDSDDDNIPRTPTPPASGPRRGARPGVRPGVRPGARRIQPGARPPPRIPSPDEEELRVMEREERRRIQALQREEKEKKRQAGINFNKLRLGKIPKDAPPSVIRSRIEIVALNEGISSEAAEKIVLEQHMESEEEGEIGSEAEDLAQTRGIKKVRAQGKMKHSERRIGFAYEHSTAFISLTKQRRAVNVDYDEEGNEIVPDDVPSDYSSDEGLGIQAPPSKKAAPFDRTQIHSLFRGKSQTGQETVLERGEREDEEEQQFTPNVTIDWQGRPIDASSPNRGPVPRGEDEQQCPGQPLNAYPSNRGPPPTDAPPLDWTRDDYQDSWNTPSSSFRPQEEQRDFYDDGFGYPPRGPPPPLRSHEGFSSANRFPNRGRGQPQPFRGRGRGYAPSYGPPPVQRGAFGAFRAGPPPARPPGATRGHPYYDVAARRGAHPPERGHGPWSGNRNIGGPPPFNGHPPRGHHNGAPQLPPNSRPLGPPPSQPGSSLPAPPHPSSSFRGAPPPQPPPLAGAPFIPPSSMSNGNMLTPPPPPPPPQLW